ncbi:MAG: enoyl-CoA hydratase/isomerase family protein [Phycisphaerales bacterium JB063]
MSEPLVLVSNPRPGVVELTLNRPDKRNALNVPLLEALVTQVRAAEDDETSRVLVLSGAGKVFCAGMDLAEATEPERAHRSAHAVADALKAIARCRLVTVAKVHGAAIAGGAGLMAACDLIVAAQDTKVGYPEVHRGLVAGLIMHFVVRQAPLRAVSELMLTGKLIDARRAAELNLVNRAVAPVELDAEMTTLLTDLLMAAPGAQQRTKRVIDRAAPGDLEADLDAALADHMHARQSPEAAEGLAAFLEKREPNWRSQ